MPRKAKKVKTKVPGLISRYFFVNSKSCVNLWQQNAKNMNVVHHFLQGFTAGAFAGGISMAIIAATIIRDRKKGGVKAHLIDAGMREVKGGNYYLFLMNKERPFWYRIGVYNEAADKVYDIHAGEEIHLEQVRGIRLLDDGKYPATDSITISGNN